MNIDTETHVFHRLLPRETNPEISWSYRYSWHAYSGDLLVAEMDRAGVDKTFLISYDAESVGYDLRQRGKSPEDFLGGRKYTHSYVNKYPNRFLWFNTLSMPRLHPDYLETLRADLDEGAYGVKIFPAHHELALDDPLLMAVYDLCAQRQKSVLISFEATNPPRTPTVSDYLAQVPSVLDAFSTTPFVIMHGGQVNPNRPEAKAFYGAIRSRPNAWLSTALHDSPSPGDYPEFGWKDGWEYPFQHYLSWLRQMSAAVGVNKLLWGTDWPWMDHLLSYPQAIDSIRLHADFWTAGEKLRFLGANVLELLGTGATIGG